MRIHLDKIASVTRNLGLGRWVTLGSEIEARDGADFAQAEHGQALEPYQCRKCNKWHISPKNRQTPSEKCLYCRGSDGQEKDSYSTEEGAIRRTEIIRDQNGPSLRAYRCPLGNGWHLTKS